MDPVNEGIFRAHDDHADRILQNELAGWMESRWVKWATFCPTAAVPAFPGAMNRVPVP
jgi:hypothetical protein